METQPRQISINIFPAQQHRRNGTFLREIKQKVNQLVSENNFDKHLANGAVTISWYDDSPVSEGVSAQIRFTILEGVDLAHMLLVELRGSGYQVNVTVGY